MILHPTLQGALAKYISNTTPDTLVTLFYALVARIHIDLLAADAMAKLRHGAPIVPFFRLHQGVAEFTRLFAAPAPQRPEAAELDEGVERQIKALLEVLFTPQTHACSVRYVCFSNEAHGLNLSRFQWLHGWRW
ncbi:MAG: hypothetical protein NZ807_07990 [Dehalococcoidia bacterium]|nr:hypothetical protein [Dehalococcoidia bacterium]